MRTVTAFGLTTESGTVTSSDIQKLTKLKNVTTLNIKDCVWENGADLKDLANLNQINYLYITNSQLVLLIYRYFVFTLVFAFVIRNDTLV